MFERVKGDMEGRRNSGPDWSALEKYAEDERRRVDGIKEELRNGSVFASEIGGLDSRERAEEVREPETWRKLGRVVLDAVNLHPKRSEKRRQQEAFAIAKKEIEDERMEHKFQAQMDHLAMQTGNSVWQIMQEEEREKRERERLTREMVDGMDAQRYRQQERYENERKQELLERDLNEKLVTVDELEEAVEVDNPDVDKRYMEYGEEEIPVYDLKGLPFAMLSHSIEYRKINYNDDDHMGVQTSKQLVKNPEVWKQRDDEFEMLSSGGQARGDVISTSYINSEHNLNTRCYETNHEPDICYGFERVEGDAILASHIGDMGSSNGFGKMRGATINLVSWEALEAMPAGWDGYNEVVLRRYDETGKPRLPDYIIAQNGKITEGMLKHAAAFNIPVVNIEEKYYNEKFRERAEEILANVGEDDDYQKVVAAFHEIGSFSPYRSKMARINQTTLNKDLGVVVEMLQKDCRDDFDRSLLGLGKMELEKRIPFIVEILEKEIDNINAAVERGEYYKEEAKGFEFFNVLHFDGAGYANPAEAEHLSFNMRLKGDATNIKMDVYRNDGLGGKVYERLEPVVQKYLEVRERNLRLALKTK